MSAGTPATVAPSPRPAAPDSGASDGGSERADAGSERGRNDTDSVQVPPRSAGDGADGSAGDGGDRDDGANASPVARRAAAQEGVDLGAVQGTARGGRITKGDVLAAAGNGASATPQAAAPAAARSKPTPGAQPLKGAAAALARYMDESRSVPTATSFRTISVTALDARRKQLKEAGHRVSFTHLIAYAIARVATDEMPVMANHFAELDGKPNRVDDGACNLGLAVDVERKDGTRTLMVPVIRDAGSKGFTQFLEAYNELVEKARTNALTADDLTGGNVSLTNPGGLGTVASVPRLMAGQGTIVATGSIAYPVGLGRIGSSIGAEKVMTMTSTYDHRIIQGAESGRFLARIAAYLDGEAGFYERVFGDLGAPLPALPAPAAPQAAGAPATAPAQPSAAGPARRRAAAGGPGRDLAAEGPPHPRSPGGEARSARPGARGRPGARPRAARPHPGADGQDPLADPADVRPRRDAGRRAAIPARDLLRADRLRDRAHRLAPPAAVAAGGDRGRTLPDAARRGGAEGAAQAADRGGRARALHAQGVSRPEAVLDRGPRHDRAGTRRADPNGGWPGRARSRARDGPPRPVERARAQPRAPLRHDLRRVRGHLDARADHDDSPGRDGRCQVPPRGPGLLSAAQGRVDHRPARVEPESPGVRRPSGRGGDSRGADHPPGAARPPRHQRRDPCAPARRCRLPRRGDRRRDAQPPGDRRLHDRRDDPHHPEQPGGLHDQRRRRALDDVGVRSGQGLRRPDHPRQRRRRRRLHLGGQARVRLPSGVRTRRADRPDWLPPLWPQRGRRARLHAAVDVPGDQEAPARARAVRPAADRAGRRHRAGIDRDDRRGLVGAERRPPVAQGARRRREGGRAGDRRVRARPHAVARGQDRGRPRSAARPGRGAPVGARRVHGPPEARQAARAEPGGGAVPRRRGAVGPGRGARVRVAADRGAPDPPDGSGHRAGHLQPAPPRAPRCQDRSGVLADPAPARCACADGAPQQPAFGDGVRRVRIRLLPGGPRDAGAVGGAVRRLRQRRPGDRRPVHRLGPGEVGPDLEADAALAPRLRGLGPRALLGAS